MLAAQEQLQGRPRRVLSTQSASPQNLQRGQTFPRHRLQASVAVPQPRGVSARGRRRNDLGRRDGIVSAVFRGRRGARSVCIQRRSAEAEPPPERCLPTPARQAPAQPSPAACRAPAPPALEPLASKGPGTGHWYRRLWHQRRKSTSPRGGNRKSTHRTPPWLKDVRRLQRTTRLLIPRLSFARVVREMLQGLAPSRSDRYYMQGLALQALQEASELFVTNFLSASYLCSLHTKRKILMRKDVIFLQDLLKIFGTSLATDLRTFLRVLFIYLFTLKT
ncbi:uncharacterized protein LOC115316963 [Ixodes scapularis]|uniref:uncharacterized protein LOC115316963 n=1 Tax=Ixodes scapularis TaxID=6945 RepID=UPI001A9FBCD7|nr:uncharacterized protein LOC115316963 [Ixodes scapularis]